MKGARYGVNATLTSAWRCWRARCARTAAGPCAALLEVTWVTLADRPESHAVRPPRRRFSPDGTRC
jgi:hypothetical protein